MSLTRKNPWKDQLWNVSLLPVAPLGPRAVRSAVSPEPHAPDRALATPAVLSLSLDARRGAEEVALPEAA